MSTFYLCFSASTHWSCQWVLLQAFLWLVTCHLGIGDQVELNQEPQQKKQQNNPLGYVAMQ